MIAGGSHALVTGGSSGIGLAIATELARIGCHVHLCARGQDRLALAAATVSAARRDAAQQIDWTVCDVSSPAEVAALFARLAQNGARPSVVVNSAGVSRPGYFHELPLDEFDRTMRVNYLGTVHVLKAAVPAMMAAGRGHILNIASVAGVIGVFGMTPYCASKFAVRGLTESLRSELKPRGIVVSLLCPPDTETPMLAEEAKYKPPETAALSKTAGVLTPGGVARAAMEGWQRGRAMIVPGLESRLTVVAQRFLPGIVERVSDRIIRSARQPN